VLLATAPANDATALPADAQADGLRPPIPVGGRRPAALPSGANQWGTILWFGSPTNPLPIWRPPDRTAAARAARAAPQPIADRPWANPEPLSDRPWTDPQPIAAYQTAGPATAGQQVAGQQLPGQQISGQQPPGQQISGQRNSGRQLPGQQVAVRPGDAPQRPASRPPVMPGYSTEPELSQQRVDEPQPEHDREFGTVTWWGEPTSPQPIWRPPDRPKAPPKPPPAATPSPHRTPPTWREPPGRRSS